MPHSLSQSPCQHHPHMLHQGNRRDKARGSRDLWLCIIFVLSRKMAMALTLVRRTPSAAVWTRLPRPLPRRQLPTGLLEPTGTTSQMGTGRPQSQAKPDRRWSSGLTRSLRPPRAFATQPSHRLHPSRRPSPSLFLPLERTRPPRASSAGRLGPCTRAKPSTAPSYLLK